MGVGSAVVPPVGCKLGRDQERNVEEEFPIVAGIGAAKGEVGNSERIGLLHALGIVPGLEIVRRNKFSVALQ